MKPPTPKDTMGDSTQVDNTLDSAPSTANNNASSADEAQDRFHSSPALKSLVDKISSPEQTDTETDNSSTTTSKTATPPPAVTDDEEPEKQPESNPEPAAPAQKAAEPEDADPTEDEVKTFGPGAQKRIQQLVAKRRAAEERAAQLDAKAKMIDDLDQSLAKAKIDRAVWDQWQQLGFLAQTDPRRGAEALAALVRELDPEVAERLTKTKQPAAANTNTKLDDDLQAMVDGFELAEATALKIQATRTPAAPARAAATERAPAPANIPRMAQMDVQQGEAALKVVDDEFRRKYPTDWDKLAPEVNKLMEEYRGVQPSKWGKIARECAEKVVAKRALVEQVDPVARSAERRPSLTVTSKDGLASAIANGSLFRKG